MSEYNRTMKNYYGGGGGTNWGGDGEGILTDTSTAPMGVYGPRPVTGGRRSRRRHHRRKHHHGYRGGAGEVEMEETSVTETEPPPSIESIVGPENIDNSLSSSPPLPSPSDESPAQTTDTTPLDISAPTSTTDTTPLDTSTLSALDESATDAANIADEIASTNPITAESTIDESFSISPEDKQSNTIDTPPASNTTIPEPITSSSSSVSSVTSIPPPSITASPQENGTTTVSISKEQMIKMFQRLDKNLYVYATLANSIIEKYPADVPEDVKTRINSILNIYKTASDTGSLPSAETILKDESFTGLQSVETGLITLSMILATLLI